MPTSRRRSSAAAAAALARQSTELAWAAPQVVAHRLARIALAGPKPSARQRREMAGMVAEKQVALGQSWLAMTLAAQRACAAALLTQAWTPGASVAQWQAAAFDVLGSGLEPVRRKAVANARRLATSRWR